MRDDPALNPDECLPGLTHPGISCKQTEKSLKGIHKLRSKRVIIIGAGLAGLTAAHAAAKQGTTVLVVDRGPIGIWTNSALANGFFAGPSEKYSPDDYIRDAHRAGRGLNRESLVRLVAREAPSAFHFLRSAGVLLKDRGAQRCVVSPDPTVIPGVALMRRLAELVNNLEGVHVLPGRLRATRQPSQRGQQHRRKRGMAKAIGGPTKEGTAGVDEWVHVRRG